MRVILASSSPRRREILTKLFGDIEIMSPDVDESPLPGEDPVRHAERVSGLKAMASLEETAHSGDEELIIASDTIVTMDGMIIGKPLDYSDAVRTITSLSGRTHSVITAITLVYRAVNPVMITSSEETGVTFKPMDENAIRAYLSLIKYSDKAGSYAAQEHGDRIIESIRGSFTNVIGFPLRRFFIMLNGLGIIERLPFAL